MSFSIEELIYNFTKFIQIIAFAASVYFFLISMAGWYKKKEASGKLFKPKTKFAIVIAAHNEERVIANAVKSLLSLDYPPELFKIFVIADNCTDKTVEIVRSCGGTPLTRKNNIKKGKGYAIEWGFNKIFEMEEKFDAFVILDADNLVSPQFLLEMNKQLIKGYKVVQGYLDSKNPNDSWITCCYSIAFWLSNRIFQLPRYYLGMSCSLSGTGFVVASDVLQDIKWNATCLTEDLEYTMKLVLNNIKVGWAHNAVVYDEKPITLAQSWRQRKRWMQGHTDCFFRYFKPLIKKAFKEKNLTALDCALYLCQPIRFILIGFVTLSLWAVSFFPSLPLYSYKYIVSEEIWLIIIICQAVYGPLLLLLEHKLKLKMMPRYLLYPLYCITWLPIAIQGIINRNNKEWVHTDHTRDISLTELEGEKEEIPAVPENNT